MSIYKSSAIYIMGLYTLICTVVIILLIFYVITPRVRRHFYNKIESEDPDDAAAMYMMVSKISHKTPRDYYDIATIYDYNFKDTANAYTNYVAAITTMWDNDNFVVDKIRDRILINDQLPEDEIRMEQQQIFDLIRVLETNDAKPKNKEKKIAEKWTTDNQNVHDTLIDQSVKDQFIIIRNRTDSLHVKLVPYDKIIRGIRFHTMSVPAEEDNKVVAIGTLQEIRARAALVYNLNISEENFIQYVYTDIQNFGDEQRDVLMENFINNLKDCRTENSYVCINGRISRVLSSYALIDEAGLGIMKSHQVVRNEVMARVGQMRDDLLDSRDLREQYEKGEDLPEIATEIIDDITEEFGERFAAIGDKKFVENLLDEIRAGI